MLFDCFANTSATASTISADLDRIGADIGKRPGNLLANDRCGYGMNCVNTARVLHGDGSDRRHGVGAQSGRRFDVRLDARTAAGVRSPNDENAGRPLVQADAS
jgi:hypothetical protein